MFSRAGLSTQDSARKRQKVSHEREAVRQPTSTKASSSKHEHTVGGDECHYQVALRKLEPDLEAMRQLITCKMCYRFLTEPYSLACGHTYCYICLDAWLVTQKKQTCPDCRAVVRFQPTPSFIVREMTIIFTTRPELLSDEDNPAEHENFAVEAAARVASDKAKGTGNDSGLFSGIFSDARRLGRTALHDAGDGVERCRRCLWEVEDGMCLHCGVPVGDDDLAWSSDGDSEISGEEEIDHELLAEQDDTYSFDADLDQDDFDAPALDESVFGVLPPPRRPVQSRSHRRREEARLARAHARAVPISSESEESSEEEEDDTNLDGFIASEAEEADNSESGSDEGSDEEPEAQSTPAQPRRRVQRRAPIVIDSDDEEGAIRAPTATNDAQDSDDDAPIMTHRTRRKAPSARGVPQSRRPTATINRAIVSVLSRSSDDSESDSNDDNEHDGISVRITGNDHNDNDDHAVERAGFSPLQSHDDDSGEDSDDSSEQSSSTARDSPSEGGYGDEEITMDNMEHNHHSDDEHFSRYAYEATY
ncbi:E3 ubiquitin ligase [Oleoguttula sp. CCFEE 5521]